MVPLLEQGSRILQSLEEQRRRSSAWPPDFARNPVEGLSLTSGGTRASRASDGDSSGSSELMRSEVEKKRVECSWLNLVEKGMVLSDDLEKGRGAQVPNCSSVYRDTLLLRDNFKTA